ncbi:MAG: ribosome-associated translation inhibitor RaiA [Bacteroidota bacterium]
MNININAVKFKTDKKLEDFIQEKIGKLGSIHDGIIGSEVTLRLDSNEKTQNKIAEIRLIIRGNDLFAKKETKSFEESIDSAIDALKKQLLKHKEKIKGI